ncbi:pyridoxal phosphate-dependent aminotransferase [Streptomyces odontomachi]|uniref:pyridoxal phosphate-dependent aminotransferase n=1 Tax=Streptomyces odontomachi TaxID=2944940 RepID=UPI00210E3AF0|nr:aminotransferase class I/II-fold pyridoxal phosphate-dependent enzyme [Streptomyces sp. ODS25]
MSADVENPFPSLEMTERAVGRQARERLSTNENEFGPAPEVVEAIAAAAAEVHRYPDCDHLVLRERLAGRLGVSPDGIRIGSGVDGLIGQVCRTFLGPERDAVTSDATYPTFGYFAHAAGAEVHQVPYLSDAPNLRALVKCAHRRRADVVYIADPDNPSGALHGRTALLALADELPEHTVLVVDGAYAEYAAHADPATQLTADDLASRRILWLRTFSKAYALAGLRIGYAVGQPRLVRALADGAEHYVVGRIAEAAALAALDAGEHLTRVLSETAAGRAHYATAFDELGFTVLHGHTNFVTVRLPSPADAKRLAEELQALGVFVRQLAAAPGLTDCLRISVGPARQRALVLDAVARSGVRPSPVSP